MGRALATRRIGTQKTQKMQLASAEHNRADGAGPAADEPAPPTGFKAKLNAWLGPDARLRQRFVAWWEGYYLPDEPTAAPEPSADTAGDATASPPQGELEDRWSAARIKVSELIWSDGFSFPGGAEHVLKLVKPMGLTKEKSMLDIGSGLGGAARVISKTFGTWVTGMEASETLAAAGMAASERAGLGKKAPIESFDPSTVILPARKFDAVFARLIFLPLSDKKRLLAQMCETLKPGGQLMFLEFVLSAPGATSPALAAWQAGEDHPPHLWTTDEFAKQMRALKMDVRVAEDMTSEFRGLVLEGWARLAKALKPSTLAPDEAKSLTHEVELWGRRIAALDAGTLRMARFYAIKNK